MDPNRTTTSAPAQTGPAPDVGNAGEVTALAQRRLGVRHILYFITGPCSPVAGVVAFFPLAIAIGVGTGTPGVYLVVAVPLLLFAVGFTRMVPFIRNRGAYYSYVSAGLGLRTGLITAYIAVIAYLCIGITIVGSLGFYIPYAIERATGVSVPWWLASLAVIAVVGLLGYFRVDIAAKVLGVALAVELTAVVVLFTKIIVDKGFGSFSFSVFDPSQIISSAGLAAGFIYAFASFVGFEGTAVYAEEARDPDKTIPRATYAAVIALALFSILSAWILLVGGGAGAVALAQSNPGAYTYELSSELVGFWFTSALEVLVTTASIGGVLAMHNAVSRYLLSLASDGFLPSRLAVVHPKYRSPVAAGVVNVVIVALVVLIFAIMGLDPLLNLATSMNGLGTIGILLLVTLTALAVVFFAKRRQFGWKHTIAPGLAALGVGGAVVICFINYSTLTGTKSGLVNSLPWIYVGVALAALSMGFWMGRRRPELLARLDDSVARDQ